MSLLNVKIRKSINLLVKLLFQFKNETFILKKETKRFCETPEETLITYIV